MTNTTYGRCDSPVHPVIAAVARNLVYVPGDGVLALCNPCAQTAVDQCDGQDVTDRS